MSTIRVRLFAVFMMIGSLAMPPSVEAHTLVTVPAGTKVPLRFANALDSSTAREGQHVRFTVATDVLVNRRAVLRRGARASGLIASVSPPGIFGKNARVHIAFIQAMAVDGRPIRLSPIDITPESLREVKDVGGAVASSTAGLILLGPVGIAAGALVRGGHVQIPAGAVAVTVPVRPVQVRVP